MTAITDSLRNGITSYPSAAVYSKSISVSMMGDSLTVRNQPNADLYNGGAQPSSTQITNLYTLKQKMFHTTSPLYHGSMRSGGAWFPFEVIFGCSGATSAQILQWLPSIISGYPNGRPDVMVVLAGTNDAGASVAVSTVLSNLKQIYQFLISVGIYPIAATPPPRNDAQTGFCAQYAAGIKLLAKQMNIPCVDFYSALVSGANGQYGNTVYQTDGIHWTPLATGICGYLLNNAISSAFKVGNVNYATYYDDATYAYQTRDPNFQTITGTINTAGSRPTQLGFGAPTTTTTVYNSSGAEVGGNKTMFASAPASILGGNAVPNYVGNTWQIVGNGAATENFLSASVINCTAGDRWALAFRIKWIPDMAAANKGQFAIGLWDSVNGYLAGISEGYITDYGNQTVPIGNESNYIAGDFYQEFTIPAGWTQLRPLVAINKRGGGALNAGDSLAIANFRLINLTAAGFANI